MERKAHSSFSATSRISSDLLEYHQDSDKYRNQEPMLRRMAPRWKIGRTPRVCIVGAGVAGLRCAEVLIEKGITVTIMEGRDRIGGRVGSWRI